MKIEKSGMENKIFWCTDCTVVEGWTVIKKSVVVETDFPCISTI